MSLGREHLRVRCLELYGPLIRPSIFTPREALLLPLEWYYCYLLGGATASSLALISLRSSPRRAPRHGLFPAIYAREGVGESSLG